MEKFILNITASSGEFYQGYCESLTLPTGDGVYGVQAGHNPVLVALHMGIAKFTVDGETREVLVGDGIAEVTPRLPASGPRSACSTSRACTSTTRARSHWTAPCSACRRPPNTSVKRSPQTEHRRPDTTG